MAGKVDRTLKTLEQIRDEAKQLRVEGSRTHDRLDRLERRAG